MDWKPNRYEEKPLYKQITDYMKEKIERGEWGYDTKIPSQRDLASRFNVNRSTIVSALQNLIAEGYVEGEHGGGTKVTYGKWEKQSPLPNWTAYIEKGSHYPNQPFIQKINQYEFEKDLIRLGTGELSTDLLPKKLFQQLMSSADETDFHLGYSEPKGDLQLREAISKRLREKGIYTTPSSILIVSGALQAIQLLSLSLLERSARILVERPSYLYSVNALQSAGIKLIGIERSMNKPLSIEKVEQLKNRFDLSLFYVNPTFHNPTGALMGEDERKALVENCIRMGLPIIEDSAYEDLWIDEKPPLPLKSYDKSGQVLYLGTMSKLVSPGLRIGWVVGQEGVIERLADTKMQTDYGSSTVSQYVARRWMLSEQYEEHSTYVRQMLKKRRDFMQFLLECYFSHLATWTIPKGGFYIWIVFHFRLNFDKLFKKGVEKGILIAPGHIYDRLDRTSLRLSYSYASLEEMEKGLRILAELIEKEALIQKNENKL
ncbi:aminotransferase-like domain-containing protein [Priestia endophytica]